MTKVLLVSNIFPPIIGGPASFIDRLAQEVASRGRDVTVVCSSEGKVEPSDAQRPFKVRRVDITNRYSYEVKVRLQLAAELARHQQILVNGLESYVGEIATRLRRSYVLKIVGDTVWETARNQGLTDLDFDTFQHTPVQHPRLEAIAATRDRYLRQARIIVTPSDYLAQVVEGWGVDRGRIVVIPNGVKLERYAGNEVPSRESGPLRVLFAGRLTNWKGAETLLLALNGLDGLECSIVGEGPEGPLINALIEQMQLSGTHLQGPVSGPRMIELLGQSHVLVLPSGYEGLSHTLLEASAAGVACIASHKGGNPEVIEDGVNGLLVPYGDVQALRTALVRLRDDEALRSALGRAARTNATRFPFEETTRRYVELIAG